MPVIQCCQVGRVKLFHLQSNRKVASRKVRSPGPEVSCKLIGCLPDVRPPLQQWEDIALASFGMILISEVADAPVIMGISKPADLRSTMRGGDIREQAFRWH